MRFGEEIRKKVWEKGLVVEGYDADLFRKDACGAWIMWNKYGVPDNPFGWEIDHIMPVTNGGGDELENLRPLQCLNNRSKGDDYPSYTAVVSAEGDDNIRVEKNLVVNERTRQKLAVLYRK